MTEIIIALIMQFGVLRSDGVIMVNNNGVDQIKQQTGVDIKAIASDLHYKIIPTQIGVTILNIVEEDHNGRKPL